MIGILLLLLIPISALVILFLQDALERRGRTRKDRRAQDRVIWRTGRSPRQGPSGGYY